MTKINQQIPSQSDIRLSADSSKLKEKLDKLKNADFGRILSAQIADPSDVKEDKDVSNPASELPEIQSTFTTELLDDVLTQDMMTRGLEGSIELFEMYASLLEDPDKTLKQSYSVLEQLISQLQELTDQIDQNQGNETDSQKDIQRILLELMTTAQVEQIKFNRGDYS